MAAARAGDVHVRGGRLGDAGRRRRLAPDEVEIQATPRPGTAVAHHDGLVVVLDTELTPGAAWPRATPASCQRAIQDLRREAGLELDDRIELWVDRLPADVAPHLPDGRRRHARRRSGTGEPPAGCARGRGRARRRPGRHRPAPTAGRRVSRWRRATRMRWRGRRDGRAATLPPTSAGRARRARAAGRAARSGAHWLVFFGLALAVVVVDQLTKAWLVANLSPGETMTVIGDWVRLVFSQNSGALFGLFRDNALAVRPRLARSSSG